MTHLRLAVGGVLLAVAAILFVLYWRDLLALAGVTVMLKYLHRHLFGKQPSGSTARTITALSAAYAAWNSRWIVKHGVNFNVNVPKATKGAAVTPEGTWLSEDGFGEVPF